MDYKILYEKKCTEYETLQRTLQDIPADQLHAEARMRQEKRYKEKCAEINSLLELQKKMEDQIEKMQKEAGIRQDNLKTALETNARICREHKTSKTQHANTLQEVNELKNNLSAAKKHLKTTLASYENKCNELKSLQADHEKKCIEVTAVKEKNKLQRSHIAASQKMFNQLKKEHKAKCEKVNALELELVEVLDRFETLQKEYDSRCEEKRILILQNRTNLEAWVDSKRSKRWKPGSFWTMIDDLKAEAAFERESARSLMESSGSVIQSLKEKIYLILLIS